MALCVTIYGPKEDLRGMVVGLVSAVVVVAVVMVVGGGVGVKEGSWIPYAVSPCGH